MVDQTTEQTTATETTIPDQQDRGSDTSTTETKVDLAADVADDQTQTDQTETDTRTDEERTADAAKETARAELFGAPAEDASYKIDGLPEGMEIDKDALDAIAPVARELNLSDKGLSNIAKVYAEKVLPGVMARATQSIEQQVIAQRSAWETEAEAAIKSNGSDLKNAAGEVLSFDAKSKDAVLKTAAKALDRLAPQGFREFLKDTGLSQNPMMVAFAYQAGKSIGEDTELETTDTGSNKPKSRVEKYYPNSTR